MAKEEGTKEGDEVLVAVEGPELSTEPPVEEKDDDEEEPAEDEADAEDEPAAEKGDARAATDADADNTETRVRRRETSKERRERKKAYDARRDRELKFYEGRNAELEQRFSELELRQRKSEGITIGQAISQVDAQIREAERLEAAAINANEGENVVEARRIREALVDKRARLSAAAERAKAPPASAAGSADKVPPPAMQAAMSWIDRNKWYDPKGGDEDSVIAQAIEDKLTREGKLNPASDEFWDEFDSRLEARGIGSGGFTSQRERGNIDGTRTAKVPPAPKSRTGGPRVSVNGSQRSLRANEVYVSPDRKKAMMDAGVWDDPVTRQKLLKGYQEYDRRAKAKG